MKQIFVGNAALALCAAFYLAWWVAAFKPVGAVKGFATGWLLLPAAVCGIAAVALICTGVASAPREGQMVRPLYVVACGAVTFAALAVITGGLMGRPVTTELPLIVGWTVLTVCQVSSLCAMGCYTRAGAVTFTVCIAAAALVSLGCYVVYYRLDTVKGWYDGMVPLVLVLLYAIATDITLIAKLI